MLLNRSNKIVFSTYNIATTTVILGLDLIKMNKLNLKCFLQAISICISLAFKALSYLLKVLF